MNDTAKLTFTGMHTFTLWATGDNNPASTRTVIVVNRVEIVVSVSRDVRERFLHNAPESA